MNRNRTIVQSIPLLLKSYIGNNVCIYRKDVLAMTDLKVFIAILVLTEETLIPANWDDEDQGPWPWRKTSIVATFATMEEGEYVFLPNNISFDGIEIEKYQYHKSNIHKSEVSKEAQKIKEKLSQQYSGEIQILW